MQHPRFSIHPMRPLGGFDGGFQDALAGPEHAGDLLRINPPEHTKLRRYLAPHFTLRRVEQARPVVERIVAERVRAMQEAGPPVDFVTAFALPCHLYFAGQEHPESSGLILSHAGFRFWLSAAIVVSLIVGAIGTIVPLRIGIKAFQRMEF